MEKATSNSIKAKSLSGLEIHGGTIAVWLPEEVYKSVPHNFFMKVGEGKLIKINHSITPTDYACVTGVLRSRKTNRRTNDISICYGTILAFKKLNVNLLKVITRFHKKFFFPGEELFGRVRLNRPIYTEVLVIGTKIQILLRPLLIYTIPQPRTFPILGQFSFSFKEDLMVEGKKFLMIKFNEMIALHEQENLVEIGLFSSNIKIIPNKKSQIVINFSSLKKNLWSLEFAQAQKIKQPIMRSRRLKMEDLSIYSSAQTKQILEPYSIVGSVEVKSQDLGHPIKTKSQYSERDQSQELFILHQSHIRRLFFEELYTSSFRQEFLFCGDRIQNGAILTIGGKVFDASASKVEFQIGNPYLFTEGAKVYKNHGDFAPANTVLGFVTYKIFKTQDIIQGLPKVEEILEARASSVSAVLAEKPGVVTRIHPTDANRIKEIEFLSHIKKSRVIREGIHPLGNIEKEKAEIESYQFINIGEKFYKGTIDPQRVLEIYFYYFNQRDSHHKSVVRSVYRLASMFVKAIQGIYQSQGIKIVDRHLEVIVRQMILKAKIEYAGGTPLVYGEYLDLQQLYILNQMLEKKAKKLVYYKPALLGLTKAALTTESFISAASFQETVRILTQASIEGRVDWLRGLKEKVIVGGLLPSGTGILTFLDEWVTKNIFLLGRGIIGSKPRRYVLRKRLQATNPARVSKKENLQMKATETTVLPIKKKKLKDVSKQSR